MTRIRLDESGDRLLMRLGDAVLAEYVFRPGHPTFESPRPYVSPVRTLGGELVSLYRPHDHVWHKGIAWSLPVVGDENFWGGPTFVRGEGYVQLANNGEQRHVAFEADEATDAAEPASGTQRAVERLEWVTQGGEMIFAEERVLAASALGEDAWLLAFETRMTNTADRDIPIGSPTTRGRGNAGYGGLFWRGPRSFTGGHVLAPGVAGGDELRGTRAPWMGFTGRHDGSGGASTIVMVDDPGNLQHPPQWFARSEEFACLCPAPFFSEEHEVAPGDALVLRYGVVIADGAGDPDRAAGLAASAGAALPGLLGAR
ncbi:methane monooxygenase PmoA-like [Agromyces ramosus]|uniref:Methane monooxygenase PmoA-like n=1 Tax=Agromyces ramosus TaxID=33879 RepID=A0A4Q7MMZ0_9MICO|nr:PmoA family protein [Agromyces ramosus]RZS68142.1 methane monooxygenase PmoA-like [Agromyces ramosus]